MAKVKGSVTINTERCKGCDLCVVSCPTDVLEMAKEVNNIGYNFALVNYPDQCTGCANCGYVCPEGCITVYRIKN
jgi:2-oxoglutarate ferredoxin oxidoreductase subunit delta